MNPVPEDRQTRYRALLPEYDGDLFPEETLDAAA